MGKTIRASRVSFRGEDHVLPGTSKIITTPISNDLKLIKIKGSFECSDEESLDILNKINSKETFLVTSKDVDMMVRFGIDGTFETLESIEFRKKKEEEFKASQEEYELKYKLATEWYDTLSKDDKDKVDILRHIPAIG